MKTLLLMILVISSSPIFAQTEVELRRVIKNNPTSVRAYANLIEIATTREQIIKFGNEAIAAIGARSAIYTALGNAYMKANDYNNAVNSYRTAISLNPRSAVSYNRLGLSLMRIGYFRQAEVAFRSAMAYSPVNSASHLTYKTYWGIALENIKDYEKAQLVINEVLRANPNFTLALDTQKRLDQNTTASL